MGLLGRALGPGQISLWSAYCYLLSICRYLLSACRYLLSACCFLLFFSGSFCLTAQAQTETYPIIYDINPSNPGAYIAIEDAAGTYEVLPGDCLWNIAENLWGDGFRYVEIVEANKELITDPNLIYPGMQLQVGQVGYIKKDKNSGVKMEKYRFGTPDGWKLVYLEEGEQCANFALSGDGLCHIACLVQDKEEAAVQTTQDWEACLGLIQDYVDAQYPDAVTDLAFEHYCTGDSEELYLYSYVYEADLTEFGIQSKGKINVCAGLKLTEHIQAEFIGFAYDYDIHGAVRYVTADFEELSIGAGYSTVNNSNMLISPVYPWEMEGMFNPFPWVEGFVDDVFRRLTGTPPKDRDKKEEILDNRHTFKGR